MVRVRALIERCLAHYPVDQLSELTARLRSSDKPNVRSSSFELLLHEYLVSLRFEVFPHPEMPNGVSTPPDFLVTSDRGETFYLEAVSAMDHDGRDAASIDARKAVTLEQLDIAVHRNLMVRISEDGSPITQPSGRRLAKQVRGFVLRAFALEASVRRSAMSAAFAHRIPQLRQ
jgi:hypothetical protein